MTKLVLASASETRARLLSAAGVAFEAVPAAIDEDAYTLEWLNRNNDPATLAAALAGEKARAVGVLRPLDVILGSDQVLLLDDMPVGKCPSEDEAKLLLRRLRGREHELVTAAALSIEGRQLWQHSESCRLVMRNFSDALLDEYIATAQHALTSCVGGYRVESIGIQLFERLDGDFFSILGLPLVQVLAALRRLGLARS